MGCNQEGKASMEKKVPDKRNWGRVMILDIGGMVLSLFAIPDTTKPKPINTIKPMTASTSMLRTVITPLIKVKWKKKCPITIMNTAPSKAKPILAIPSPNTILDFLTGVAKNRLITKV